MDSAKSVTLPLEAVESKLTTLIQVAGGPWKRVYVDTGSSGLVVDQEILGSSAHSTGRKLDRQYGVSPQQSRSYTTDLETATVTVQGGNDAVATKPLTIATFSSAQRGAGMKHDNVYGVLGIAAIIIPKADGLGSPLAQLPAPYRYGYTFVNGNRGLLLGAPTTKSNSVTVSLTKQSATFSDGLATWDKIVHICWTIGTDRRCGPTSFDTGGNYGTADAKTFPNAPHVGEELAPGTTLALSTLNGLPITTATSTESMPIHYTQARAANTGLLPFHTNQIGFDFVRGIVVITPSFPTAAPAG